VRARLLVIVGVLMGLLAIGLGVPLALFSSQFRQSQLFTEQLTDTVFFASLAERPVVVDGVTSGLEAQVRRYDEVFGVAVTVYGQDGKPLVASRTYPPELDAVGRERLARALANRRSDVYPLRWPWNAEPMVIAEPVLADSEVRGAVVTVAPTAALQSYEITVWAIVGAAVVAALAAAVLVALPIVRWILRPVHRLDEGTGRVAAALLAGASPDPVADGTGPPELRQLSVSFDRMAETVAQAYGAQRAFVADASHQLRNPLTALRLRLSNLDGHVEQAGHDEHEAALEEADRLSTLLDGLLALARAERTKPLVAVNVDEGVDDRIDAWRPLAEHSGMLLRRSGPRGLVVTATDGAIETVLDAVLDNAVKFTPEGGSVIVAVTPSEDEVEIAVRDTGPGLPPDELERATDRFWRSPAQANVEGSGLGLAIASRTVELAGGTLSLDLPAGGGLRVTARLPRGCPEAGPREQVGEQSDRRAGSPASDGSS
jgi:signal transduction histidine kinase